MTINKNDWLLDLIDGKWRFIDHTNKLLTHGWIEEDEIDIEKVSLKSYMLEDYKLNYLETF